MCLQAVDWPFENFCDQLCQDLFSPSWEVRHGAATALREVVRVHGGGAGKAADQTETEVNPPSLCLCNEHRYSLIFASVVIQEKGRDGRIA